MDNYHFKRHKYLPGILLLGKIEIWANNYPYAVGINGMDMKSRPSRLTILKMGRKLKKETGISVKNLSKEETDNFDFVYENHPRTFRRTAGPV